MSAQPEGRYVYAIVGGGARGLRARGIGGRTLVRVREGRLAAVAEPMAAPPAPSVARLRAQDRVVRRLARGHDAILPARFGSFARDARELRRVLRRRSAVLSRALARVRGTEQMNLRLLLQDNGMARAQGGGMPTPGKGTRYLRARAGHDLPALAAVRSALAQLSIVRAELVEVHSMSPRTDVANPVVTIYHLIARGTSRKYRKSVIDTMASEQGASAAVSGPWPPYAFAAPADAITAGRSPS
jgi:Gas vesicle synthesis protein GvpL/GvpF